MEATMEKNIREILEAPFPEEAIRTRKGTFGRELSYAEVTAYIGRLNQAFAGDWSFDITEHRILDNEVMVLGKLTTGDIHKTAFGCSAVTTARESGEKVSLGDDLKAAASDALKKCCSLLGLGLHLYGKGAAGLPPDEEVDKTVTFPAKTQAAGSDTGNGKVLTSRQFGAIMALAEKAGYSEAEIKTRILDAYGTPVEKLDRRAASKVITELNTAANGNGRAAGGAA